MASVRKREWEHAGVKKTAWVVEYTDPATGKRKRFTPKSGLKKDAEKERLRIENEVEAGTHTPESVLLNVSRIVEDFMKVVERREADGQIGRSHATRHRSNCDKHIKPKLGRLKHNDVSQTVLEDWYFELRKAGYKPHSIKAIFATLRMAEGHAKKLGRIRTTPVADAMLAMQKAPTEPIKTFTANDIRKLLAAPRLAHVYRADCALRCFVHVAACCGLRFGEIAGLTVDNLDLKNRVIRVRHNLTTWGLHKGPKTRAGIRDVPMSDNVVAVLTEWMEKYHKPNPRGLVMISSKGCPYTNPNIRRLFRVALKTLGLDENRHFHSLRHFAASWMVHNLVPLTDVANLLGHNKFDMTLQVYAHPVADHEHRHRAITKMAADLMPNTASA